MKLFGILNEGRSRSGGILLLTALVVTGITAHRAYFSLRRSSNERLARTSLSQAWNVLSRYEALRGHSADTTDLTKEDTSQVSWRMRVLNEVGDLDAKAHLNRYAIQQEWNSSHNLHVARQIASAGYNYFGMPHNYPTEPVANVLALAYGPQWPAKGVVVDTNELVLLFDPDSDVGLFETRDAGVSDVWRVADRDGCAYCVDSTGRIRVVLP